MKNKEMQKCIVEIEDWQMQCCGTPFKIGDKVEWFVQKKEKTASISQITADYYYEHHSTEWQKLFKLTGVVADIKAQYYSLETHPNPRENNGCTHYRVSKTAVDLIEANGYEKNIDELEFGSYLVILCNYIIEPAEETEIDFS